MVIRGSTSCFLIVSGIGERADWQFVLGIVLREDPAVVKRRGVPSRCDKSLWIYLGR
jgi:hypothetical protein